MTRQRKSEAKFNGEPETVSLNDRKSPEWKAQKYRMGSPRKRIGFLEPRVEDVVSQKVRQNSEILAWFDRRVTV
jgi:hypothetical protein